MTRVLSKLKNTSGLRAPSNRHDLGRAIERADDARDIAKDLLRQLPDYDGSETEDTARHEVHNHTHVHMPSAPERDTAPQIELGPFKARGLPRWLVAVFASIVAAGTAIVAHFARK